MIEPPHTLIAELTHRCPLRCAYCSNPIELEPSGGEIGTAEWLAVLEQAASLGIVQVHFTGGEPLLRDDLGVLVQRARELDLYCNLITSGHPLSEERLRVLVVAGVDHVQISIQDTSPERGQSVCGGDLLEHKLKVARWVKKAGLALTLNFVLQRENIEDAGRMIDVAEAIGADRVELANVQYLGWAAANRGALLPGREAIERARAVARAARERLSSKMDVVLVTPDYHADRPRACMDGWARRYLVVTPSGHVLPCHAARSIASLSFERVSDYPLSWIWACSEAFNRFRGTAWMPEPCRSCDRREVDFGGCRCQAFALTGDAAATDPACALAPAHSMVVEARREAERGEQGERRRYLLRGHPARSA